jgi:hypothetical protein
MALHLIKLAVGVDDLSHMKEVQAGRRKQRRQGPRSPHWVYTRNTPRRAEELVAGGSLYWVVRGVIRCRQELVGFENDFDEDSGKKYCRIKLRRTLVPTAPRACKAFQGGATSNRSAYRPISRAAIPATCRRKWRPS